MPTTGKEPGDAVGLASVRGHVGVVDQVPGGQRPGLYRVRLASVVAHRANPHDATGFDLVATLRGDTTVQAGYSDHQRLLTQLI